MNFNRYTSALAMASALLCLAAIPAANADGGGDPASQCPAPEADGTYLADDVQGTSAEDCDLVGAIVVGEGGMSLMVPPPGSFVSGEVLVEEDENGVPVADIASATLTVSDAGVLAMAEEDALLDPGPGTSDGPCEQAGYTLLDVKWYDAQVPMNWRINRNSIPNGLNADNVVAAVRDSMQNITTQKNTCNLADEFNKTASYMGETTLATQVATNATCTTGNGSSTVGFGQLDDSAIAATCHYGVPDSGGGPAHVHEVDIRMDNTSRAWTTNGQNSDCSGAFDVENIMTHEFGHWWGVYHAGGTDLTMYRSASACQIKKRTLGLGDVYGLRKRG